MTSDHLFPILESEVDSGLFGQVGSLLAVGNVPPAILQALRLGRMTALCKPDRGIVVQREQAVNAWFTSCNSIAGEDPDATIAKVC